jgi:hypothetical protein
MWKDIQRKMEKDRQTDRHKQIENRCYKRERETDVDTELSRVSE